jgi:type IV secretion system protein VirB4
LAVISASTDNIEIMHRIVEEEAAGLGVDKGDLRPEQWLPRFYAERKGSGKGSKASPDSSSVRQVARV